MRALLYVIYDILSILWFFFTSQLRTSGPNTSHFAGWEHTPSSPSRLSRSSSMFTARPSLQMTAAISLVRHTVSWLSSIWLIIFDKLRQPCWNTRQLWLPLKCFNIYAAWNIWKLHAPKSAHFSCSVMAQVKTDKSKIWWTNIWKYV